MLAKIVSKVELDRLLVVLTVVFEFSYRNFIVCFQFK